MKKTEQIRIAKELLAYLEDHFIKNIIEPCPEDWGGFEIRQALEDTVKDNLNYKPLNKKTLRYKAYSDYMYGKGG